MKKLLPFASATVLFALVAGCGSSGSSNGQPEGPVIDTLDVPATTSTMTISGQSGPGVVLTLTAHDDDSGLTALHCVFTEGNVDQAVAIPNAPTELSGQQIELVVLNAPSGNHEINFHLTDQKGRSSAPITKTITVP